MEKKFASNYKIKYILLSILFSILFIFTALSNPIEANAAPLVHPVAEGGGADVSIPYVINLNMYESNEEDESTNDTAGYLSYAASGDRCGVMFYVIDDRSQIRAIGVLLDDAGKTEYG